MYHATWALDFAEKSIRLAKVSRTLSSVTPFPLKAMQYEHDDDIPDEENQLLLSSGKHSGTHAAKRPIASHSGSSPPSYYAGYVEHAEAHVRTGE